MSIGKLTSGGLSRLGGGLGSLQARRTSSPPPPPPSVNGIVKEDSDGFNNFILTENNQIIDDTE